MGMAARIPTNMSPQRMNIDPGILTLSQWLSPSFPIGAFAYSHGLETAIQGGQISTAEELTQWLEQVIARASGRNDCILLRAAHGCCDELELAEINATALAFASSAERRLETQLQGTAFCQTAAAIWGGERQDLVYPVAVGAAAARLNIDATLTSAMFLQAFTSNLISVAVRAVPLGQTEGQSALAALTPLCQDIATQTALTTMDDLQSTAFLSDIAAMRHETLQPRIFRT